MVRVAPIRLAFNPRTLWFDPRDLDIHNGDDVVVLTARGVEFGHAAGDVFEIDEDQVKKLKSPLKPVKRIATPEDVERAGEMERLGREALPIFKEMAAEANEDMHPVSVEYLLEGDKAVFYFEAEERVDFRELVRKLASRFHVRVDMRQIGVRDEARMVGGLGHCGQELCCARLGGEFCPVSIRMAKEQDLSLNPQKISGVCGRLMCCLRYEFDTYKDFKSRAPKQNATVKTPDGPAKVVDLDVPREVVSVRLEGEKPVRVPLSAFDAPEEGSRPNTIGQEAWDEANAPDKPEFMSNALFSTDQFTGRDKLAEAGSVRRTGSSKRSRKGAQTSAPPKSRIARAVAGRLKSLRKATMPPSRILRRRSKTSNPLAALPPSASRAAAQIRRRARPSRASSPRSARQNIKSRSAPKRRGEASRSRVPAPARSPRVFARSLKSRHRLRGRVNRERAVSVLRRAALPRKTSIVVRAGARTRPAAARKTKAKESKCPSTTRF